MKQLKLIQVGEWPFNIHIYDESGDCVLSQGRYAYSSKDKSVDDVLNCFHHKRGKDRDLAHAANKAQIEFLQGVVDRWNNHDAMVEALEACIEVMEDGHCSNTKEAARQALKSAKGD